ncbi:MAG: glycosyltransferase family 4 protein, partial [Chitinispirillaceae bacterium]
MNILILTNEGYIAGSTNSIAFLAKGLAKRGHSVHVGCRRKSHLYTLLENSDVNIIPMAYRKKFDLDDIRVVRDTVRSKKIQLVNAQSTKDRYASILARWLYKLPVKVVHTRRQSPLSSGGALQRWFYVKGTERIVVISDKLKEIFLNKGYPSEHLHVIYNGTPSSRYEQVNPQETEKFRKELGIRPGETIIGCVSRRKRQDQLVKALAKLDTPARVCFAGVKPGTYDELAEQYGVKDRIIYAGIVDLKSILNLYPLFSVNVLCSITDGFGLVLVESMAMGVPVVATRANGIINVVDEEESGLLFEDNDIGALAQQLRRVL